MTRSNPPPVLSVLAVLGLGLTAWYLWPRIPKTTVVKDSTVVIPPGPITLSIAQTARVRMLMNDPNLPRSLADQAMINTYMNS